MHCAVKPLIIELPQTQLNIERITEEASNVTLPPTSGQVCYFVKSISYKVMAECR